MQQIQGIIEKREVQVTGYHLTGYSLGGFNAAFITHLDETEGVFDFRRVLRINPRSTCWNRRSDSMRS